MMEKQANLRCGFCSGELEAIHLSPRVQTGLLSMLFGYSIGTHARLVWSYPARPYQENEIPFQKQYDGHRCSKCGRIVFRHG